MLHAATQTPLNADFAAFCPVAGLHHLLAVGTYQLDDTSQTRLGRLHLYDTTRDGSGKHDLAEINASDQPGIFGIEWLQSSDWGQIPCLVLALADGTLRLMQMKGAGLEASSSICIEDLGMVLSVDSQRQAGRGRVLAASTASCQAALVQVSPHGLSLLVNGPLLCCSPGKVTSGCPSHLMVSGQGINIGGNKPLVSA